MQKQIDKIALRVSRLEHEVHSIKDIALSHSEILLTIKKHSTSTNTTMKSTLTVILLTLLGVGSHFMGVDIPSTLDMSVEYHLDNQH